MNLTAMPLIFQSGGCWLTTTRLNSWPLWACSCLSTMPPSSVSVTNSDVLSTATTLCFSCGPCISPLFRIGPLPIPTALAACSVSTVVLPKCLKTLDTLFHQPTLNNTTHLSATTSCLGTSVGACGVFVLVTWQQPWFTNVSLSWDLYTHTWQKSSLSTVWWSLDNWSWIDYLLLQLLLQDEYIYLLLYSYLPPLLLPFPTFCKRRHLVMADAISSFVL